MIAENEDRTNRSKAKPLPPIEYLRELFIVDPTSPSGLRWKVNRGTKIKAGRVAGAISRNANGKIYWKVLSSSRPMKVHRVIMAITSGVDLAGMEVDHINGDGCDNRVENLRLATSAQNKRNCRMRIASKSGVRGVDWASHKNKWRVRIRHDGGHSHIGYFRNLDDARRAREEAELRLHGEFSPLARKEGA
jgi:hypothetical protein